MSRMSTLPKRLQPMLATLTEAPFDDPSWVFEDKYDGFRMIAEIRRGKVALYSRNGKIISRSYIEVAKALEGAIERLCSGIAAANGAQISVHFDHRYPATVNSVPETNFCRDVAGEVFGSERVLTDILPSMGAEDFSYMLREKPGCYVWLGNGPGTGGCTLHNPHYDFNDELLTLGVSYWVKLVHRALPVT